MMSLFTPFDCFFFPLSKFLSVFFFLCLFIKNKINFMVIFIELLKTFVLFFYNLNFKSMKKFSSFMFCSIFSFIFILNFMSVFPFIFPLTSSFGVIATFSVISWMALFLFQVYWNLQGFLSHFIPEGCPLVLMPMLFVIEIVSMSIRPITLSVRLTANILAGHLLMILLSKFVFLFPISFYMYIFLNLVELFVSLIQSYIFCTMMSLYYSEVN